MTSRIVAINHLKMPVSEVITVHHFKMHLQWVAKRSWAGIKRIYFGPDPQSFILDDNNPLYYFYILGLLALLFCLPDLILCLLLLNISSYLLAGSEMIFFDWRLTMHIAPLVCLATALGIVSGGRLFYQRVSSKSERIRRGKVRRPKK